MITIADAGGSNISSIQYALKRLGYKSELTGDADKIYQAKHVIIPGVGAAKDSMSKLQKLELVHVLKELSQPTLGICVGMQLLFDHSEEGDSNMLGIIDGQVKKMQPSNLTIPHMGWNQVNWTSTTCPLAKNIESGENFYFVHSFAAEVGPFTQASTTYGESICSVVQKDNYFGVQFHPEKSALMGSQLLRNFVEL